MNSKFCKLPFVIIVSLILLILLGSHFLAGSDWVNTTWRSTNHFQEFTCGTVRNMDGANQTLLHKQVSKNRNNLPVTENQNTTIGRYAVGKRLVYSPITGCKPPQLLERFFGAPCWKYKDRANNDTATVTCAPKVVVLGIHKCGTTDLRWSLNSHKSARDIFFEPYSGAPIAKTSYCPTDLYSGSAWNSNRNRFVFDASKGRTTVVSSGGCFSLIRIVEETPDHYLVRSCVQMLTFYQSDETRYIITLRNPTERMISHYFYLHKIKKFKLEKLKGLTTPESVGHDTLHEFVESGVKEIEECLKIYGVTRCILFYGSHSFQTPIMFIPMIIFGCYPVFLEEIAKFIPKERLYVNMLEEYSADESKAMVKISEFIGLSSSKYASGNDKESQVVRNQGANQKPVHKKTVELLDRFYQPFNKRLAVMLGDDKWLYTRV